MKGWFIKTVITLAVCLVSFGFIRYFVIGVQPAYLEHIHLIAENRDKLQSVVDSYAVSHQGSYPASLEEDMFDPGIRNPLTNSPKWFVIFPAANLQQAVEEARKAEPGQIVYSPKIEAEKVPGYHILALDEKRQVLGIDGGVVDEWIRRAPSSHGALSR